MKKYLKKLLILLILACIAGGGGYYYYEKHYNKEDPKTAYRKSMQYEQGAGGVKKDPKTSIYWLTRAANLGYPKAQMQLAYYYHTGNMVTKNEQASVKWYRKAADAGVPEAQYMLGYMYQNAIGVPKNDKEAKRWYGEAGMQDNQNAQLLLGVMFSKEKNNILAYVWLNLAATSSIDAIRDKAVTLRDTLAAGMKPEDIVTAQKKADTLYKNIQEMKNKPKSE